jgi:hypothetical protein
MLPLPLLALALPLIPAPALHLATHEAIADAVVTDRGRFGNAFEYPEVSDEDHGGCGC